MAWAVSCQRIQSYHPQTTPNDWGCPRVMIPVIALVGRPNVGKSTLYNRLTGSRDALVDRRPGVTRDRLYGTGRLGERVYWVVDTGGVELDSPEDIQRTLNAQVDTALEDCDVVMFVVDSQSGVLPEDRELANKLRRLTKPVFVVVNKTEGMSGDLACAEFHSLGLGNPWAISALHGDRVVKLIAAVLPEQPSAVRPEVQPDVPHVAVVGRPNVGKSTLVNALLAEDRVLIGESPGTTRDSVKIPFRCGTDDYVLVDTAGVRRRSRVQDRLERFSVVKTLRALEQSNVVIFVLDAQAGLSDQDAVIAGLVEQFGRSMVLVVNKAEQLNAGQRRRIRLDIMRKLGFLHDVKAIWISALRGTGLSRIFPAVKSAYDSAMVSFGTPELNRELREAVRAVPPPLVAGRRIRLKYAHQGGKNPPVVVIHGNLVNYMPSSYRRYLANYFRKYGKLSGTPVRIALKQSENPYAATRGKTKVGQGAR